MHEAAAVITFLSPGLRFFHQGEFEGRKKRISPHLVRGPQEPVIEEIRQFYNSLLSLIRKPAVRTGRWQLLEPLPAWEGNDSWDSFVSFLWEDEGSVRLLVAVNYSRNNSQCFLRLPLPELAGKTWLLADQLSEARFERNGDELFANGLYLDMEPWQYHVLEVKDLNF